MSDMPGEHLTEEPQSERGPMGSRDTGSDEPGGGPTDRPEGRVEGGSESVDAQESQTGEVHLPTGDQGG
ncbi:MAG: hypothetical protein ACJ72M_03885 [Propionibacteriaceae bacterium]|jgi:hypothetical protein